MRHRVQQWKERLYDRQRGWVDGTTQFAHLIRKHLRPPMHLLDLGAGAGKAGPVNFRGEVARVVGVDLDWAIQENNHIDFRALCGAECLPFRTSSFDVVFADWVVEHLANPTTTASEIFRVLRPDGWFIFRTGNLRHYSYVIASHTPHWFHRLVANPVRGLPRDGGEPFPTYYRMNTCSDVRSVLTQAGLVEEELLTVEAEPSYLMFSVPSFLLGVTYERLVNRFACFTNLRACLFGCFRKSFQY